MAIRMDGRPVGSMSEFWEKNTELTWSSSISQAIPVTIALAAAAVAAIILLRQR
jgi:hypothetical protein